MSDPGSEPTPKSEPGEADGPGGADDRAKTAVANIEVDKTESVTLVFEDGAVAVFGLEDLRRACPCAGCRSQREQGQRVWPLPGNPMPLELTDAALHGAWALTFTWNDGHTAGIFPFTSLRRWHDGESAYLPDSGLTGSPKGHTTE